ncbi:MAG: hypothetical protein EB154_09585 [Nitrosopumilaceae archaeon]|nr:hypothetical protein [Nitrososphaeria archaeon]NDF36072.1 hypothetical protein [Nitrosopumilaceae archaeon]
MLKLVALLMILPLLTLAVASVQDADASSGDGKSCSKKDKTMKNGSYSKSYSKLSLEKMSKKSP